MDVSLYSGEKEGLRRGRQEGQAGRVRGPLHTDRRMTCLGSSWYELWKFNVPWLSEWKRRVSSGRLRIQGQTGPGMNKLSKSNVWLIQYNETHFTLYAPLLWDSLKSLSNQFAPFQKSYEYSMKCQSWCHWLPCILHLTICRKTAYQPSSHPLTSTHSIGPSIRCHSLRDIDGFCQPRRIDVSYHAMSCKLVSPLLWCM